MKPNYVRIIDYRRVRARDARFVLDAPEKVYDAIREMKVFPDDGKEHFGEFLLDFGNQLIGYHPVCVGTGDHFVTSSRDVFGPALRTVGCARVILVHNHPSGRPDPSYADIELTKTFVKLGRALDVHVIDHVIVATGRRKRFASMAQEGLIRDEAHHDTDAGRKKA